MFSLKWSKERFLMDCSHEGVCTKGHQIAAQLPYVISRTIEWRRIEGISAAEGNFTLSN